MPKLRLVAAVDAGVPPKFSPAVGTADDTGVAAPPKLNPGAGAPKPVETAGVDAAPKAKPGLDVEPPKLRPL